MFPENSAYQKLSDQQFAALTSLCDAFDEQLQLGTAPVLEDFLAAVSEVDRGVALAELLAIEIDFRTSSGEQLSPTDYETRFAQDHDTIVSVFREVQASAEIPDSALVASPDTPSIIGDFRIIRELGRGGMGVVYEAHQQRLDRRVAIKVLLPAVAAKPELAERFLREGLALARLQHPNIVSVYDADEKDGKSFLAMELIDGRSLTDIVRDEGPLEVAHAVQLIIEAARGLEYAHRKGVIHRDVKPSNLLLHNKEILKVLDLGLARLTAEEQIGGESSITKTGDVMGTVDFMAPEQAVDIRAASEKSDVYSLGCTLYYLVTGQVLYERDTVVKTILAHREEPRPTLSVFNLAVSPGVVDGLDAVLQRMLTIDPMKRMSSMTDVIKSLSATIRRRDGEQSPGRRKNRTSTNPAKVGLRSRVLAACALVSVLVVGGMWQSGYFASTMDRESGDRQRGSIQDAHDVGAGDSPKQIRDAAAKRSYWSFDGETNYIHVPDIVPANTDALTIEMWVRMSERFNTKNICRLSGPDRLQIGNDKEDFFAFDSRNPGEQVEFREAFYELGQWHHVAFVSEATQTRLYLDGSECVRKSRHTHAEPYESAGLYIGAHPNNHSMAFHFKGDIDELHVANGAMYSDEFIPDKRLKTNAQTIAMYHFDEPAGTWLLDAGPEKHHARAPTIDWDSTTEHPPVHRTFWPFDGKANFIRVPDIETSDFETVTTEAWIRPRPTTTPQAVVSAFNSPLFQLGGQDWALDGTEARSPIAPEQILTQSNDIPQFDQSEWRWHHVAKVVTPTESRFYLDGIHRWTTPHAENVDQSAQRQSQIFVIGAELSADDNEQESAHFHGDIDELRVSRTEKYTSDFEPELRLTGEKDADTLLLLHFDESPGTTVVDSGPQSFAAIPSVGNWDEISGREPHRTFWTFDGETTFVHVPNVVRNDSEETTLEAWVRPKRRFQSRVICHLFDTPRLHLGRDGDSLFGMDGRTGVHPHAKGDFKAKLNFDVTMWHHVAIVVSESETRLYLNGRRCTTFPRTELIDERPEMGFYIGAEPMSPAGNEHGFHFQGDIDEIRLSDIVRYSENFIPSLRFSTDENTTLLFHFDDEAGSVLTDSSGNEYHGQSSDTNWR